MSELDLDAIEARAKAATPGPWTAAAVEQRGGSVDVFDGNGPRQVMLACGSAACVDARADTGEIMAANARFVAHAREDVPALIAELRRLREVNTDMRDENEVLHKMLSAVEVERDRLREESRWIPVEERLPERFGSVLVANTGRPFHSGRSIRATFSNGSFYEDGCRIDPIHWREMPAPPEVKA